MYELETSNSERTDGRERERREREKRNEPYLHPKQVHDGGEGRGRGKERDQREEQ